MFKKIGEKIGEIIEKLDLIIQALNKLSKLDIMLANLQQINLKFDKQSKFNNNFIEGLDHIYDQNVAIMTNLITDKDKEDIIRFYGSCLGKNMIIESEEAKLEGVISKIGIIESYSVENGEVVKEIKPYISNDKGEMLFAYPKEITRLEKNTNINWGEHNDQEECED